MDFEKEYTKEEIERFQALEYEFIFKNYPAWLADNCPDWVAKNHPEYIKQEI